MPVTMLGEYPGSFGIDIRFPPEEIAKMNKKCVEIEKMTRWERLWPGIADDIKEEITRHLDQGIDPDWVTWAPLSPIYRRRREVGGRVRMTIKESSSIRYAYVNSPDIHYSGTWMIYAPNEAHSFPYHEYLRGGWRDAPPREWFGISIFAEQKFQKRLDEFVQKQVARLSTA